MRGDQLARQRLSFRDPPRDFHLDAFMRHSFKVMHDELHTVKVCISPEWSRWVGEEIWHESQRGCWEGGCGLEPGTREPQLDTLFRVAGMDEIRRWVLSLGPEVRVIEPKGLREMFHESLSRNLAQETPKISGRHGMTAHVRREA